MKIQGFTIIFALVSIPLILVLTYYIQLQVDTIALQNEYDSKLLDATYDAMSSFELNTANEDLSSVSDSLRTIIEASNNVFFNTLSTNLGLSNASKSYVEPYIPAILYTLYDGYYISAPTQVPNVLTDPNGNAVSVGDPGVKTSGNYYTYQVVHTNQNDQKKCPDGDNCSHIDYDTYNNNPTNYIIKYEDSDFVNKSDYGQLLYATTTDGLYTANINMDNDRNESSTDTTKLKTNTKNVLKTYMPYSARYKDSDEDDSSKYNFDITVIYTLDNYITIDGSVRQNNNMIHYTKSGYLIPKNSAKIEIVGDSDPNNDLIKYNQNDAQNFIESGAEVKVSIGDTEIISGGNTQLTLSDGSIISLNKESLNIALNSLKNQLKACENELIKERDMGASADNNKIQVKENLQKTLQTDINKVQYELDKMSAVVYYTKATIFSNWVYDIFVNKVQVKEKNLVEISGQQYTSVKGNEDEVQYKFDQSDLLVFDTSSGTQNGITEIPKDSAFYNHKLNVIRNSIQYNLNLAMSTYNLQTAKSFSYEMPVLQNEEWDKILTNPSIVSFMQGYSCGLKIYNNYMVVSSTNNEISISPENIYYVEKDKFSDETSEYHKIDCKKIIDEYKEYYTNNGSIPKESELISFNSKEVKYDKYKDKNNEIEYLYDHKNLACYDCINDGNYKNIEVGNKQYEVINIFDEQIYSNTNQQYNYDMFKYLRKGYYLAVGKERNNLFKMNAIDNSQGYEIIYNIQEGIQKSSTLTIGEIKSIEIVIGTIKTRNTKENLRYNYKLKDKQIDLNDVSPNSILSNDTNLTYIRINLNPKDFSQFTSNTDSLSLDSLGFEIQDSNNTIYINTPDEQGTNAENAFKKAVKYIRVIYK